MALEEVLEAEGLGAELLSEGLSLLDEMPFPVIRIASDYQVQWMNRNAVATYGVMKGYCYAVSHGYDQPCNLKGEQCPKLQAEMTGDTASVLHIHQTSEGEARFKVIAQPLRDGGVLEWHIPLDDVIGALDCVTGLLTRNETELAATRTLALMERMGSPFAVLIMDLDNFKAINDHYGHMVGDVVLSRISQLMAREIRKSDVLGRWGGDEFLAILPDVDSDSAEQTAERILDGVRTDRISSRDSDFSVSLSAGLCWVPAKDEARYELGELVEAADRCLYLAKDAGRDCLKVCTLER